MIKKNKKAKTGTILSKPSPNEAKEKNGINSKLEETKSELIQNITKSSPKPSAENGKPKKLAQDKTLPSDIATYEDTVISVETEINGSITSRGAILVNGKVNGNITSEANVRVSGSVEGDITGKSVEIQNGSVVGNLKSKSSVTISEESTLKGDIECDSLILNGNVNGNSQVHSSAKLGSMAVIYGDLTTQNLSIQEGAIVNGAIKVNRVKEVPAEKETANTSDSNA